MLSQSTTQITPTNDLITLSLTTTEIETLNGIFQHLGTIHFNGQTINSPLITVLKKTKSEAYIRSCNAELEKILNAFKNQSPIMLPKSTYEQFADYIIHVTGLSFKYYTTMTQLTDLAYNPDTLSALCAPLIKTTLTHLLASAKLLNHRLKTPTQSAAMPAIAEQCKTIADQVDSILTATLSIIDHTTHEKNQTTMLESLDLGLSIYLKLEKIKSTLCKQKTQMKKHYQYSANYLLGRLLEHPQLNANPPIAANAACSHYFFTFATKNNASNLNKAYQLAIAAITHYENQPEDPEKCQALKADLYATRIIQLFLKSISNISDKEMSLAKEQIQEMISLSEQLPPTRLQTLINNAKNDSLVHAFFDAYLNFLNLKFLNSTVNTIDLVLNDVELLNDLLNLYLKISIVAQKNTAIYDHYKQSIELIKTEIMNQKLCFAQATIKFNKLSKDLANHKETFEASSHKFLAQLTRETKTKIQKKKPKQSKPLPTPPKPTNPDDAEPTPTPPEPNTPPFNPYQVSENARLFFSTHSHKDYLIFVNEQAPEDKAEGLLYSGDYHLLADDFEKTLTLFQNAYDLATQQKPINQKLIDNLEFSLGTTDEYLKKKLDDKERRKAWLENNRRQFILLLGYEHAAYFSLKESNLLLGLNKAEVYKYIFDLGDNKFKAIGKRNQANNIPVSEYTLERERVEIEKKELEAHIQSFSELSQTVKKRCRRSALQANTLYKKTPTKPNTAHSHRKRMRK